MGTPFRGLASPRGQRMLAPSMPAFPLMRRTALRFLSVRTAFGLVCAVLLAGCGRVGCGAERARDEERVEPAREVAGAPDAEPATEPAEADPAAGRTGAGGLRRVQACQLLSRREVARILDAPIGRPVPDDEPGMTGCIWPPAEIVRRDQAHVRIEWEAGSEPLEAGRLADIGAGTEPGPQVAQRLALGDEAAWSLDGKLSVRKGTALITVDVRMGPESRRQGEALARKILERLEGAPLPDPDGEQEHDPADPMTEIEGLLKDGSVR